MPLRTIAGALALAALAAVPTGGDAGESGLRVHVAPGDYTPFRRFGDMRLFRDRPGSVIQEDRGRRSPGGSLESDLDRLQSRTVAPNPSLGHHPLESRLDDDVDRLRDRIGGEPEQALPRRQARRDMELGEQRLRTLKTRSPTADAVPLLDRQIDRLQRPTRPDG